MTNSSVDAEKVLIQPYLEKTKWIPISDLIPNPKNPRIGTPEKLDAIVDSMINDGFLIEKPLLVRSIEATDQFEIIGGHTRWQAAQIARLDSVLCVVETMDDNQAILRLAKDNLNDPFPWYSLALYVAQNAAKGNKSGLSRTDLIKACMGKDGAAAKSLATRYGSVGDLLLSIGCGKLHDATIDQEILDQLLNPDFPRISHLYELSKADSDDWPMLTVSMISESWTVDQCKSAVEIIKQVCAIPEWLHPAFDPITYKLDCIGNPNLVSDLQVWVDTATKHYSDLPDNREVKLIDGDKYSVEYWNLQDLFVGILQDMQEPSTKLIDEAAQTVLLSVQELDERFDSWQKSRESDEALKAQKEEENLKDLERKRKYTPIGIQQGVIETLESMASETIDLIVTDCTLSGIEVERWLPLSAPLLKPGGLLICICDQLSCAADILNESDGAGLEFIESLVWETLVSQSSKKGLHPICHRMILVLRSPGKEHHAKIKAISSVLHEETEDALFKYLLTTYSEKDASVLDPFGSSGNTAVAAKSTGRCCTWIESKRQQYQIANSRIEKTKYFWEKD